MHSNGSLDDVLGVGTAEKLFKIRMLTGAY